MTVGLGFHKMDKIFLFGGNQERIQRSECLGGNLLRILKDLRGKSDSGSNF